ncbi:DUF5677 domain-containing protein [Alteriqipengyuania lutimaris]|uniref:DUF5677 domain-containing protein n=1 Tax=Alteriqipengyuania lutimaris TaxID=1538146 RepID=UPI001CFF4A28|nr:DUF5677 domain-containing protein [Alteriqipengyuania lutimaris]
MSDLFDDLPRMLAEHDELDSGFRERCYERWKGGLDLLRMFIVMSEEFGDTINSRERQRAFDAKDHKFEATIMLHARAVRVANEISTLLREGYPDGVLSRWRTLHEIAVVATFLNREDERISYRFLAHRGIAAYKALVQYEEYLPRSNMTPLEPGTLEAAKAQRDNLLQMHGPEFAEEMGWAYPALKKTRINLFDLEKHTGLDHWRPRFKWASDDIHAGPKPYYASLAMAERRTDQPALVTGPSNSGFTDPAHMCAISLNLANFAIPSDYHAEADPIVLMALRRLSDQVGDTFYEIDRETGKRSARALQEQEEGRQ